MDELTKEFLAESQEGVDRMERCLTELELRPTDFELLGEIFRVVHTIKGATGFLGFTRLEKLTHAAEYVLAALREGSLNVTPELISGLLRFTDYVRAILRLIEQGAGEGNRKSDEEEDIALIDALAVLGRTVPGTSEPGPLDRLTHRANRIRPGERSAVAQSSSPFEGKEPSENGELVQAPFPESIAAVSATTLRVDVAVLNRMMDLVGELVLTRNQMLQGRVDSESLPELSRRLDGVTSDLRETVMQARMQPVAFLFSRFTRVARDLARACGRRVKVEFSGQETGLDKGVLEALKDPLTHAVRNAIDHGIEAPADRLVAGKPIEGVVRLKAYHQSGSIVIEVSDDGAGISPEAVVGRALAQGFISQDQASAMSDREILQLIFQPGFSTANELTHVSGRGVGMDVVRTNVEAVGGSVELETHKGLGTTLRLRVPLTLAIIPALIVRSGGDKFALPQSALIELIYVPAEERDRAIERMGDAEVYFLRESLLPIVWLDKLLGLDSTESESKAGFYLAIVQADGCRYGLGIDDLLIPEEIVVKPLAEVLRQMRLFSGATVLGDGSLALILDIAALATRARVRPAVSKPTLCVPSSEDRRPEDRSYLVFEEQRHERAALPLNLIERIERIASCQVEYADKKPFMQYRGGLLRLVDKVGLLLEPDPEAKHDYRFTVLICRASTVDAAARVGLVVREVLDVGTAEELRKLKFQQGKSLMVIKEKVTVVDEDFSTKELGRLEVA